MAVSQEKAAAGASLMDEIVLHAPEDSLPQTQTTRPSHDDWVAFINRVDKKGPAYQFLIQAAVASGLLRLSAS
jgi:hypothetical protein